MSNLNPLVRNALIEANRKLIHNECELSDEQIQELTKIVLHRPLSKAMVCDEVLHISQSTFNQWLAMGWMPKGRNRKGFNELAWWEDEILECRKKIKI